MRDSWQGQTPRPSSGAACTSLRSSVRPASVARYSQLLFLSFLPPSPSPAPLFSWQKISVYAHTERDKRARWIEEVEKGGVYIRRSAGRKDTRRQPVLPFCASADSATGYRFPEPVQAGSRVARVAGRCRGSAEASEFQHYTQIAPLRVMGLEKNERIDRAG